MRSLLAEVDRLQRLAVFESAGRLGSFTAAARELHMTQPAVTRHIRSLERSLGVDLFIRTANRSQLSDAGRRFHAHVAAGFASIEIGLDELSGYGGTFVLAAHPGVAQQWLMPMIDDLQAVLEDQDLRLWLFDSEMEVESAAFDAAVRVGIGEFPGQSSIKLFDEVVVPVATPTLAERFGLDEHSSAADVYRAPFVHMDDGDHPWMTWSEWLNHFGITLTRSARRVLYNNYPMVVQQTIAGRGIGLGWRPLIDDHLEGGGLVPVGPEVRSHRAYYLTWPSDRSTAAVAPLAELLAEAASNRFDAPNPLP